MATPVSAPRQAANGNMMYQYRLDYEFDTLWSELLDMANDPTAETRILTVKVNYPNKQQSTTTKQVPPANVAQVYQRHRFNRWIIMLSYRGLQLQVKFDGTRGNALIVTSRGDDGGLVEGSFIPDLEYVPDDDAQGDQFDDGMYEMPMDDFNDQQTAMTPYDGGYEQSPAYDPQQMQQQYGAMTDPRGNGPANNQPQRDQRGRIVGDKFGKYLTLSIFELLLSFVAVSPLCVILSLVAFFKTIGAHSKIKVDGDLGRRKYKSTRTVMIVDLIFIVIGITTVAFMLYMWYTNQLPQQLGFIYDLLG